MTKKDYILIANSIIKAIRDINIGSYNGMEHDGAIAGVDTIINYIGVELEKDNPKFEFKKFKNYILKDKI